MTAQTKLLDFLPPYFRTNTLTKGLAQATGRPFDFWRGTLGAFGINLDPDGASSAWLNWLLHLVGHPQNGSLTERKKRNLIKSAGAVWLNKGIKSGLESYVQAVAGVSADVVEVNTTAFIAGVSVVGDPVGAEADAWQFRVEIPAGSIPEAELRELLELVAPSICNYTVIEV